MADISSLRSTAAFCLTLAAVVAGMISIRIGFWPSLAFYCTMALLLCAVLGVFDRPGAGLFAIAVLTLGPFAGPVIILGASGSACKKTQISFDDHRGVPDDTRAELIFGEIAEGRRPRGRDVAEPPLQEVFTSGTLADQQTALAAIVRYYTPDLRPALQRALSSEIPAVRVQASSVFAQLRDTFAIRARTLLAGEHELSGEALETEIAAVLVSGFVDPAELEDVHHPVRKLGSMEVTTIPELEKEAVST